MTGVVCTRILNYVNFLIVSGVWSLMATYLGGAIFNLLFTPVIIRELGARKTLIVAELSYLIYVAINFYPGMTKIIVKNVTIHKKIFHM